MEIDNSYIKYFTKVTQMGAYGAYLFKGKGDKISADKAAVDRMRIELNKIKMDGKIVIGEGELDEAPMLYIGEKVGNSNGESFDIAVDPLEGTNFTAKNLPNAMSVIAVANKGDLFEAPETYMEKIAVGPNLPINLLDLDNSVEKNIKLLSEAKNVPINKITASLLNRPRHKNIINELTKLNVKIKFITDGDVAGVLSVADAKSNVDIFMGIGGGPEGVLSAAALSCMNCQMQTRLVIQNEKEKFRCKKMGINKLDKKYYIDDMIKGDVIFCATGVTDGDLVKGIVDKKKEFYSETLVTHRSTKYVNIVKTHILK